MKYLFLLVPLVQLSVISAAPVNHPSIHPPRTLSVRLSLLIYLPVFLSLFLSISIPLSLFFYLSLFLYLSLSLYLSFSLSLFFSLFLFLSFFLSFFFLRLLLLTHFGESPMCEIIFHPIFWHNQKIYAKKNIFLGNFYFFTKKS